MNSLNKKLLIVVGAFALLSVGLLVALKLTQEPQIIEKEALETPASLSLSPSSGAYNKDQQFAVNIFLNTGGRNIVGVDVSLSFDSEKLQVQEVAPGSLFENQIVFKNEVGDNKILLSLGSFTPYTGSGVYGTIQFLGKAIGSASVSFDSSPYSKVSEQGAGNILGETSGGSYEITETAVTFTPTPTGQITPTLTPTPSLTLAPTLTLTPTQIPTATFTPSPTLSPTPTSGIGGPPAPTATPTPPSTSTPLPTSTPTPITQVGIGGSTQPTSTPQPTKTLYALLPTSTVNPTPTPVLLPVAGFNLPSIFIALTSAVLIISALIIL